MTSSSKFTRGGAILLLSFLAALPAASQDADALIRMADPIIARILPALRAEDQMRSEMRTAALAMVDSMANPLPSVTEMRSEISSGKDVLSVLKSHSSVLAFPDRIIYAPRMSKALSDLLVIPMAFFSFGLSTSKEVADAFRLFAHDSSYTGKWIDAMQRQTPEMKKATDLLQRLRDFYAARSYRFVGTIDGLTYSWISGDVSVSYSWLNLYMNVVDKNLEAVPTGPILMVSLKEAAPPQKTAPQDLLKPELEKIGMTMDDYSRLRTALFFAYGDSMNEGAIQPQVPPRLPSDMPAAEIAKVKASYEKINLPLELRRSNLEVYKRHIADLEPVMKALAQR